MKKVLFVNQDITPYVAETELSVMGRLAPQKVQENGYIILSGQTKIHTYNKDRIIED